MATNGPVTQSDLAVLNAQIDTAWLAICGMIVCFMQAGFAALEVGSARVQNSASILLLKFAYTSVSSIAFFFLGFDIAFSTHPDSNNTVIGLGSYNTNDFDPAYIFFQLAFANTASTIVSGALLERTRHLVFFSFIFLFNIFLYPVVAHWEWSLTGFLSSNNHSPTLSRSVMDYAGAGVVHMTGGLSALVGSYLIGPRDGFRDENGKILKISGHSVQLSGVGALILYFGFFAFNAGSTLGLSNNRHILAANILNNTALAGSGAGLATLIYLSFMDEMNIDDIINATLTGLVAITSGCNCVVPVGAVAVGAIAGLVYLLSAKLVLKAGIDDPVNAISVHAGGGIWGLLGSGLFASLQGYQGLLLGDITQFAVQILTIILVGSWSIGVSFICFFTLNKFFSLRVSIDQERHGLDAIVGAGQNLELLTIKAALIEINGLEKLLENVDDPLIPAFHEFLSLEYAAENLDFLIAVKNYRNKTMEMRRTKPAGQDADAEQKEVEESTKEAKEIWGQYVSFDSPCQINVSSVMRKATEEDLNSDERRRIETAFSRCYYEVLGMISRDPWRRFIQNLRDEGVMLESAGSRIQSTAEEQSHFSVHHRASVTLRQIQVTGEGGAVRKASRPDVRRSIGAIALPRGSASAAPSLNSQL